MQLVQGTVIVKHSRIPGGFPVKKNTPLYRGDTIYTAKKGRARFMLNDGSIMTLASTTKLIINSSIYDPNRKRRSSFLSMDIGKARFWVTKLLAYKESSFKVKTSTSVAGVRGSDFIITATPTNTEVITLENTQLEVVSLAAPEEKPVILSDFQKTHVAENGHIEEPVKIPVNEIKILKQGVALSGGSGSEDSEKNESTEGESTEDENNSTGDENDSTGDENDSAGDENDSAGDENDSAGNENDSAEGQNESTANGPISSDESNTIQSNDEAILVPDDTLVTPDFSEEAEVELGSEMIILIETEQKESLDPKEDETIRPGPPELPGMPGSP